MGMVSIARLDEAADVSLAGGKGAALARMIQGGFKVPDGFVVTLLAQTSDKDLPGDILEAFDRLGAEKVAVRSSALAEDGMKDAWAGQMDSFLNVDRAGLVEAVRKCWQSTDSDRVKAYANQKGLTAGRMAVVIQEMINGDVSGVAFSVNPVTQDKNQIMIEAVTGLADELVSGRATPDNYIFDRQKGTVKQTVQQAKPLLSSEDISELAKTIIKIEDYFGFPVDVEWTFKNRELYILQSRPITTLG